MTRIQFSLDGVNTDYTLVYNPISMDAPQARRDEIKADIPTVEGESIIFTKYFDDRRGKMTWRGYPDYYTGFFTQIAKLETYLSETSLYMRMNDIGTSLNIYTTYTKIKIISINRTLRDGGSLIFDSVDLIWENAE